MLKKLKLHQETLKMLTDKTDHQEPASGTIDCTFVFTCPPKTCH